MKTRVKAVRKKRDKAETAFYLALSDKQLKNVDAIDKEVRGHEDIKHKTTGTVLLGRTGASKETTGMCMLMCVRAFMYLGWI